MTVDVLIRAVNNPTSAQDLVKNVAQLAATKDEQAIPTLVEVLKFNNPGAAVAAVNGLINIGEAVVPYLLENVDGYNYGARAWMLRIFAGIGDPRALDLLIEAANKDFAFSVRRSAAKGLGNIQWHKVPDSEREVQQQKVCDCLFLALEDGEWVVRYGAIAGLEGLSQAIPEAKKIVIKNKLTEFLTTEPEAAIRARIQKAILSLP
ncbi:HEAT repeat domain-containing protein [Picosynechococcus sp. PCC 11901]|uniref:HEAT repeat domain-containing protein n=1 Tax=Picosynechococcus sp. PCC 11901 TaxID=2579791 RepID=UPI0010FC302F|nr:HEAT repeat domain-containing protein [Picosynechococcus sp. PCC 11901]QCS50685.1 HEAT repeat domain-containing protein [Picosynechococcus sp. PCC 11901]